MLRNVLAAIVVFTASLCGEAAAQRVIAYNQAYLPAIPDSNIAYFDHSAVIVMENAEQIELESEMHMPWTVRQHRIQIPIGDIVRNAALATYDHLFITAIDGVGRASAPEGAVNITISDIDPGYDYRQPDERRPAREGEFLVLSTPSAEMIMRITFSNAEGVLYDTWHPPFAEPEDCAPGALCVGTRVVRTPRRGPQQTGLGNSKEVINRALHEAVVHQLLIASCEFDADTRARALGERVTEEQVLICRYPGYELVSGPNDND